MEMENTGVFYRKPKLTDTNEGVPKSTKRKQKTTNKLADEIKHSLFCNCKMCSDCRSQPNTFPTPRGAGFGRALAIPGPGPTCATCACQRIGVGTDRLAEEAESERGIGYRMRGVTGLNRVVAASA